AQPLEPRLQQRLAVVRSEARTGLEHGRPVRLLGPGTGAQHARRRDLDEGADRLSLDDHVPVMRREAAALEPGLAPELREQRYELAEMRRAFDRAGAKAEPLGHRVVVHRCMAAVLLLGEHLAGLAKWPAKRERGIEGHRRQHLAESRVSAKDSRFGPAFPERAPAPALSRRSPRARPCRWRAPTPGAHGRAEDWPRRSPRNARSWWSGSGRRPPVPRPRRAAGAARPCRASSSASG